MNQLTQNKVRKNKTNNINKAINNKNTIQSVSNESLNYPTQFNIKSNNQSKY